MRSFQIVLSEIYLSGWERIVSYLNLKFQWRFTATIGTFDYLLYANLRKHVVNNKWGSSSWTINYFFSKFVLKRSSYVFFMANYTGQLMMWLVILNILKTWLNIVYLPNLQLYRNAAYVILINVLKSLLSLELKKWKLLWYHSCSLIFVAFVGSPHHVSLEMKKMTLKILIKMQYIQCFIVRIFFKTFILIWTLYLSLTCK